MSLENDISYVYENVYQKAQYDDNIKGYIIRQEDYVPLNLTNRQLNVLRKMCKHSNIKLEYYDYRLPSVENETLFREYQEIKKQKDSNPNSPDIVSLEKRRIEIRNQIVTDNLALVRAIVDRNFEGIEDIHDKEEIYQLGYEVLFTLVDHHKIVVPRQFTLYLSAHLITEIMFKIYKLEYNVGPKNKRDLEQLQKARAILSTPNHKPTTKELARKMGFDQETVEKLLNIEDVLNSISIDGEIEKLDANINNSNSPLYSEHFEIELIKSSVREFIQKILNTLPTQQKDVIMLSYGFQDGRCYNDIEIGQIMGLTHARIGVIRRNAIANLQTSLRANYLKEVYDTNKSYEFTAMTEKQLKELEEILLSQIPKTEIVYYISTLSEIEQNLLLMYLGFEDNQKYTLQSLAGIFNTSVSWILNTKNELIEYIRNKIIKEIQKHQNIDVTYGYYLKYLINKYILSDNYKKQR